MTIRTILMAGVAGAALMAAPAMAQNSQTTTQIQATAPSPNAMQVDKLVGKSVRNASGDKIGDIEAVYVTPGGQVDSVIIGVGGFLGLGERDVAVKWSDLKVSANGDVITSTMTKDSLKALPEYTYKDKTYRGRVFSDTGLYKSDRKPADMASQPRTSDRPAVAMTDKDKTTMDRTPLRTTTKGFTKTGEMSADALIGATVKNNAGESVGEIKDIHLNKDGSVKAAVVGVGGFLGVGERDVLMPWSQLQVVREGDDDLVVRTEASKDSLKSMPEYQM